MSPAGDQPSSSEKVKKELQRRNSRPTVERTSPKPHRLRRQSTVLDEFGTKRRGSKYEVFFDLLSLFQLMYTHGSVREQPTSKYTAAQSPQANTRCLSPSDWG